jgi:hypothetical protein
METSSNEEVNKITRATASTQIIKNAVSPRSDSGQADTAEIGIIKGLSPERLITKIELRLRGYIYNSLNRTWEKSREGIMNEVGIGNFLACLQVIEDNVAFSFYHEKDIPRYVYYAFAQNYPTFITYANEFDLDYKDYNIIETVLFHYILSVYMAARHGGHRNAVRGTLSENVMAKLFEGGQSTKKGGIRGWLNNYWGRKDEK